jgi:ATP-dependent DNA helicase RecG
LTVFPIETLQYDPSLFRQLLNNCIAHQEYTIGGRIYLDEYEDSIVISNPGRFLPGNIEAVLKVGYTPPYYRNQLLSEAMAKFNLIDTAQMGIRKVFNIQRNRYFPMPDYAFETPPKVAVTVYGQVIDENTMRLLFDRPSLDIEDVFLIDKVQKKLPFSKKQVKRLRDLNIIKGKMPNIFVSSSSTKTIVQKNSILRFQA